MATRVTEYFVAKVYLRSSAKLFGFVEMYQSQF